MAEKAILELQLELHRQYPREGQFTGGQLAILLGLLNLRVKQHGVSAAEMCFRRDQNTFKPLEVNEKAVIQSKYQSRANNHGPREKFKTKLPRNTPKLEIGQSVIFRAEVSKLAPRPYHLFTGIEEQNNTVSYEDIGTQVFVRDPIGSSYLRFYIGLPTSWREVNHKILVCLTPLPTRVRKGRSDLPKEIKILPQS